MAGFFPILTTSDFVGSLTLSKNSLQEENLTAFIEETEKELTLNMLGSEIFIGLRDTDESKYTDLIDGVDYTDSNGKVNVMKGFKAVLKQLVWALWIKDNWQNTPVGNVKGLNENSSDVDNNQTKSIMYERYNTGIDLFNTNILPFLLFKTDDYGDGFCRRPQEYLIF